MSTDNKIEQHIYELKNGAIVFTEDFRAYGSPNAVKASLSRMVKKGLLIRLARGIYTKPKQSELVGKILPQPEDIAIAIAKRDKARIIPTGVYAQYILGLSTQIPLKMVYLTDGSPRKINIGKYSIQFKATTPKNLALKGDISKLAIQALKEIGQKNITEIEEEKILEILKKESHKNLKHDISLAPQWIGEILAKAL